MAIDCTNNGLISVGTTHSGGIVDHYFAYRNVDHSSSTEQCLFDISSSLRVYIQSNTIKVYVNAGVDGTYTSEDISSYVRTNGINQLKYIHLPYFGSYFAPTLIFNGRLLTVSTTTAPSGTMTTYASKQYSIGSRIFGTSPLLTGGIIEEHADLLNVFDITNEQKIAITNSEAKGAILKIVNGQNANLGGKVYSYHDFMETNLENEIFGTWERTYADGDIAATWDTVGGASQAECLASTADSYYIEASKDDDGDENWNSNGYPSINRDYPVVGLKKWLQYRSNGGLSFTSRVYLRLFGTAYCSQTLSSSSKTTTSTSFSGYIPWSGIRGGGCDLVAPASISSEEEVDVYYFALDFFYQKGKIPDKFNGNDLVIISNVNQSIYGRPSKMRSV